MEITCSRGANVYPHGVVAAMQEQYSDGGLSKSFHNVTPINNNVPSKYHLFILNLSVVA